MIRTTLMFAFLVFSLQLVHSQNEKLLKGKVIVKDANLKGIFVVNLVNEKEVVTNAKGEFAILAKADDVLVFAANHVNFMRVVVQQSDYEKQSITVELVSKIIMLDEVEIDQSKINAVDLGIIPSKLKSYTPAERRLATAGEFKPIDLLKILGGSMPLDPVINAITGRTKQLRKEVNIERKESLLEIIDELFPNRVFAEQLKIPVAYISGFKYYVIEDTDCSNAIQRRDRPIALFRMTQLAETYNKLINDEK